ncbi:MAG: histidinol-phosphate transaminase [Gammaproteobacteria bacterium]|nr:histidinol-phosphate transaminase [Gammaproteobacteria bacterium]
MSFIDLAVPGIRCVQPYVPGKPLAELEREYGVTNAIKLASNENPLGPSPLAVAAVREGLHDLARYPDGGCFALKAKLAARPGVHENQITLGNGSNDILEFAARAFVTPEHEVIFSEHAFAVYPIVTQIVGARARVAPARDWGHDLEAMRGLVNERTRLIFIANPNNPTGTWLAAKPLEDFISSLPSHVMVVVDEAYFEYACDACPDYPDALQWLDNYSNLIVARTFSKIYGLAGLRIGYGVAHPEVANLLDRVRQPFNVNSLAQLAAEAALDDVEHIARSLEVNRQGMKQLTEAFAAMQLPCILSAGNFVAVDVGRPAAPIYEALLREGVIVRPVANYGMPRHLRVTVGLPQENERCIEALKKVLASCR